MMVFYFLGSIMLCANDNLHGNCKGFEGMQYNTPRAVRLKRLMSSESDVLLSERREKKPSNQGDVIKLGLTIPQVGRKRYNNRSKPSEMIQYKGELVDMAGAAKSPQNGVLSSQRKELGPTSGTIKPSKAAKKQNMERLDDTYETGAKKLSQNFLYYQWNQAAGMEKIHYIIWTAEETDCEKNECTPDQLRKNQAYTLYYNQNNIRVEIFFNLLMNWMEQTDDKKSINFVRELEKCYRADFYMEFCRNLKAKGKVLAFLNGLPYEYCMKTTSHDAHYFVLRSAIASNYEPTKFEPENFQSKILWKTYFTPREYVIFYINWIEYHCFDKHIDSQELVPKIAVYPVIMLVPEFFYYLKHKMNYLKSVDPSPYLMSRLSDELRTIDQMIKMDFRRLKTDLGDEDFNMIIAFRTHVLSYLKVCYVFRRAYHLYVLCSEQIRIEKLCEVRHIQAFCACICFTHDFEAEDEALNGVYLTYTKLKKDEEKLEYIKKYLEESFIKRKNTITIALFSYIDAHDRYMKLMFVFDNKSHIMIPAKEFVLVLAMDSNKSKIEKIIQISVQNMTYALRKEALNSISYKNE